MESARLSSRRVTEVFLVCYHNLGQCSFDVYIQVLRYLYISASNLNELGRFVSQMKHVDGHIYSFRAFIRSKHKSMCKQRVIDHVSADSGLAHLAILFLHNLLYHVVQMIRQFA
jgi:hypothetical protein